MRRDEGGQGVGPVEPKGGGGEDEEGVEGRNRNRQGNGSLQRTGARAWLQPLLFLYVLLLGGVEPQHFGEASCVVGRRGVEESPL